MINDSNTTGPQTVILTRPDYTVIGGSGLLTVIGEKSGEMVFGGSGGVDVNGNAAQTVYTKAGSTNTIEAMFGSNVYFSFGNDSITTASGGGTHYDIYGTASVSGSTSLSEDSYISGTENFEMRGAKETFTIMPGGTANISGASSVVDATEDGGTEKFNFTLTGNSEVLSGSFAGGDVQAGDGSVTVYEAASRSTLNLTAGTFNIADLGGSNINAGGAKVSVTESGGRGLTFIGGSGSAMIITDSGGANITVGSGLLTVNEHEYDGTITYNFNEAIGGGTVTINDFRSSKDILTYTGFTGDPIKSQTVSGGSLYVTLQNNTTIILEHETKPLG
jgi:hypothetical protein